MERDEGAVLVARREHRARVEHQAVRRPVRREGRHGLFLLRTVTLLLGIASVFGGQDQGMLVDGVVAVRPAKVITLIHLQQLFRRIFRVVVHAVWPLSRAGLLAAETVATMLRRPHPAVERAHGNTLCVANSPSKMRFRARGLVQLARVELPDPAPNLDFVAKLLPMRLFGYARPL